MHEPHTHLPAAQGSSKPTQWSDLDERPRAKFKLLENDGKCVRDNDSKENNGHASGVFGEDVIQQSVCCKLSNVVRGIVLIQGLQLRLALIELFVVSLKITNIWPVLKQVMLST